MRQQQLQFIRFLKFTFIRLKLHYIFEPFFGFFLNLAYLSKLSKKVHEYKAKCPNDFYTKWDYSARYKLYEQIHINEIKNEAIDYFEFGVANGQSFKWWLAQNTNNESKFYGFDTFEGLPEDWGMFKVGEMSAGSNFPVTNDDRGSFYKGLFQDTLAPFLKEFNSKKRKVILMDADLYSSTLYVLTSLAPLLQKGDIILFDEFTVPTHEFMAFENFCKAYYLKFEILGGANNFYFSGFKLV